MNALAQQLILPRTPGQENWIQGPLTLDANLFTIGGIISKAIPFIFAFAGIGLLLMVVASGITLMTSAGDPKKAEAGKQRLTYALVGFLVIFTAYWLVQMLGRIFGFQEITNIFGG